MLKAFSSLRARVLLLIAIPFALMLGMTIYHALGGREDRLTHARSRKGRQARSHGGTTRCDADLDPALPSRYASMTVSSGCWSSTLRRRTHSAMKKSGC